MFGSEKYSRYNICSLSSGLLVALLSMSGCFAGMAKAPGGDDKADDVELPRYPDRSPPELTAMPFDLTLLACEHERDDIPRCFVPFGYDLDQDQVEPSWAWYTQASTDVYAVGAGEVLSTQFLEHNHADHTDMFKVVVRDHAEAAYAVEYIFVKNLQARRGDWVEPGDIIGQTGDFKDSGLGYFALAIKREESASVFHCPQHYFDEALKAEMETRLGTVVGSGIEDLCEASSVYCDSNSCSSSDYRVSFGDIDNGALIYKNSCSSCHGSSGEGAIGPPVFGAECLSCGSHQELSRRTAIDMPPEGACVDVCADDVAAYMRYQFTR